MVCGSFLESMFGRLLCFCITFSSIEFALTFQRCWDGLGYHIWCFFGTFSVRARNLVNLQQTLCWFYRPEKHDFDDFHDLFRYLVSHWILMNYGIHFGSNLAPSWHQNQCFGVIVFLMISVDDFFIDLETKWPRNPKGGAEKGGWQIHRNQN